MIPILSNRMQSRNHPFNQSQRPLLERRQFAQPQVVKSVSSSTSSSAASSTVAVPTRGFNDFSLVRQYENLNHNNMGGRGYPYGDVDVNVNVSDSDFIFSDNNVNYNSDDDDYEEVRVYHKNQINNRRNLYSPPPPPPPVKRVIPRPVSPINVKDDGPFVFGVHTQNTFTPAYDKTAKLYHHPNNDTTDNKNNAASPNSSQVGNFLNFILIFIFMAIGENINIMYCFLSSLYYPFST